MIWKKALIPALASLALVLAACGTPEARLSISRPDGLNSDAHLSRADVLSIRDYLSMVLGEI